MSASKCSSSALVIVIIVMTVAAVVLLSHCCFCQWDPTADANKDGFVDLEELEAAETAMAQLATGGAGTTTTKRTFDTMFTELMDRNKDGCMDIFELQEFAKLLPDWKGTINQWMFSEWDKNGDGCIAREELLALFKPHFQLDLGDQMWKVVNEDGIGKMKEDAKEKEL